jgi:iron complex transport system permease protein
MQPHRLLKSIPALVALCLVVAMVTPFLGMQSIAPTAIWESGNPDAEVFWRLRLPRMFAGFLAGAGLSVSGMVFQALFRNPLATPFTLGVSSGAALGAALYFFLGAGMSFLGGSGSLLAALGGGLASMCLVYGITRAKGGFSTPVMLLAGVIINFFCSSLVMFVQYLSGAHDALRIMHWLMGSLTGVETARLADLCFVVVAGSLIILRLTPEIDLLVAGEEWAASRGVAVRRAKILLFAVSSIVIGAVVSLAGPIGFVGMMIPHVCRLLLGWRHRLLLPAVFFAGGCFLVVCDMAARLILAPAELPIGIVTALIGGPFFLWTLFKTNAGGDIF